MNLKKTRILSLLVMLTMVLGLVFAPITGAYAEEAEKVTVDIVSFNDFHGNVTDLGKDIGMAKMIAYSKTLLEQNPNTIFVSAGDSYQGTAMSNLTHGKPVTAMMKAMGVVASAVGNHEFDWGAELIPGWAEEGGFDFLAANIIDKTTGEPVEWAKPYKIVEAGGIKIALIGLAHPETTTLAKAEYVEGFEFTDPVEAAKTWIEFLEAGKAEEGIPDVIIALTHLDSEQDSETKVVKGSVEEIASVEGIDGIISGHSHLIVAGEINGVPIAQGYKNGRGLAILSIELGADNKVVNIVAKYDDLASKAAEIVPDPEGQELWDAFNDELSPILDEVIGEAAGDFTHNSREENVTLLGRWSSEVMKEKAGVQVAIQNGGGLRESLEKGSITMGDMYAIMPFDNQLVTMELKGSDLKKAIDHGINHPDRGNGQFAGLIVEFDKNAEHGNRVTKITLEDGTPIDMEEYYTVTTNDFLITGGDGYDFSNARNVVDTYIPIRDVLVEAIKEAKVITPVPVDYLIEAEVKVEEKPVIEEPAIEQPVVEEPKAEELKVEEPVAEEPAAATTQTYVVKAGDVLWRIARQFGTTWEKLAEFNSLKNPHLIFPGQKILIPAN
ncbi:bifunctional 2',3'-cyclic nucleotide 2'-phosphodiesterase/3'-nucleotidase precursor protein [Proteiniborus sp. DW1]|uniref:5'-nucleotidase C-terminal domain-containing protein n=1 Tax=Proteiniborus sp. DW1 TaxID=1889883 RepID=UPI00092E0C80|nr:5'-nucleotidase C-terminal domain-containing protein [Proteiniborus sp. DW1]SCG81869.1 bifunctional 2',3'-cyclic nucleotide 2'-phosphodiesterase/3'-nucleotidase precursor protein [Proteiniborus sp. DW1]